MNYKKIALIGAGAVGAYFIYGMTELEGIDFCVVAEGAQNAEVRVRIYQAVQALFSVEAHKISIVEMGSQEGT